MAGYSDPENAANIDYFLQNGIKENDGAHYVIVIEADDYLEVYPERFPSKLPKNVEIIRSGGRCYNYGTVGLVLNEGVRWEKYKYFVWLDSSVRGPFLPAYLRSSTSAPWHRLLTLQLNSEVKLVGGTISCGGISLNHGHPVTRIPHVHGYLQATDKVGLKVLLAQTGATGIFSCHPNWLAAVRYSEMGASEAILKAGYNIGSLMLRYQGVDFREESKWNCNQRISPLYEHMYDGININPLEVMFTKVQHWMLITQHPSAVAATKYYSWSRAGTGRNATDINSNQFVHKAGILMKDWQSRGMQCFDAHTYVSAAPMELAGIVDEDAAWAHFLNFGYREGRAHKFNC